MTYSQILERLEELHPDKNHLYTGEHGLALTEMALEVLGSPQERVKIIHIAGTSGKSSTAKLISEMLAAHGFKVGLQISPHIENFLERFQINNKPISEGEFASHVHEILQTLESRNIDLNFFQLLPVIAYHIFAIEEVDYIVMETGIGGKLDPSNVVHNPEKLCVITSIGMDHMSVLGNTLESIAGEKAGIIQTNNFVITAKQEASVLNVFENKAKEMNAELQLISPDTYKATQVKDKLNFEINNLADQPLRFEVNLLGTFQKENLTLALHTLYKLASRDKFNISLSKIKEVLANITISGRLEKIVRYGKTIYVDGAHNEQKITNLIESYKQLVAPQDRTLVILDSSHFSKTYVMLELLEEINAEIAVIGPSYESIPFTVHKYNALEEIIKNTPKNIPNILLTGCFELVRRFKRLASQVSQ